MTATYAFNSSFIIHTELDAVAVPRDERDINTIYFPDLEGDREREFGNAPAQAKLPAGLLIERGATGTHVNLQKDDSVMQRPCQ